MAKNPFFSNDLGGIVLACVILTVVISSTSEGFLSFFNINANLQALSVLFVVGLAQMSVLSLGHFNLAIGSMGCLSAILIGLFMEVFGWPVIMSLLIGIFFAGLLGAIQGILVDKSGINPFIITLALLSVYQGIAAIICKGKSFQNLSKEFMAGSIRNFGVLPLMFIVSIIIGVVIFFIFRYLKIGRMLLACGANPTAAIFSSINLDGVVVVGHTLSGVLCGLAGILQMMRFGSAQLSIGGDWMMKSFMAAILGGTLLSGGKISTMGTLIGALLVTLINNALMIWGVSSYSVNIYLGMILIFAYILDKVRKIRGFKTPEKYGQ
jgi:ribose transport system permease protein